MLQLFAQISACEHKLLNPSIPKAKYVGVMLMKMTILVMENASLPVTKKHQNILPESQPVTKKHRCFFDVFS